MTENNTPQNSQATETSIVSGTLASRWDRLGASLIDGSILLCIVILPIVFFGRLTGFADGIRQSLSFNLAIGVAGIIVFVVINGQFLISTGQTVGKKVLGIKIVDLHGNLPTLKDHLLKRYAFYFIPGKIPVVGSFISAINILFIFGDERRCIHDLVAGTKVVNC